MIKIDGSTEFSDKVLSEKETRKRLMNFARGYGLEKDLLLILSKWDNKIKYCTDLKEKQDMAKLAAVEVHALLGKKGHLYVDNQLVYKDYSQELEEKDKEKLIIDPNE